MITIGSQYCFENFFPCSIWLDLSTKYLVARTALLHRLVRLKFAAFFSLLLGGGWFVHLAWKKVKAYN